MDLHSRYPALSDLRARARQRIPHFVWEYLESATGVEDGVGRNRAALDRILFRQAALRGAIKPDLSTRFLGRDHAAPFGIAPVGMSGLIWPEAEKHLARHGGRAGIPYTLSTVASVEPEKVGGLTEGRGWFQLYAPKDPEIRADMLRRAWGAGFRTLVLTVDLPAASRRERLLRSGLTQPPRLTPRLLAQVALRPAWAFAMQAHGLPRMRFIESYADSVPGTGLSSTAHLGYLMRAAPDWDYVAALRDLWQGDLILKGVCEPEVADRAKGHGVNALWVSTHAGRQFDGAPGAADLLPEIRAATNLPLVFDSGVEGGLDILRALALGADFVMLGRAWHYALAALGHGGPAHLHDILVKDMESNMAQIGARTAADLAGRLIPAAP